VMPADQEEVKAAAIDGLRAALAAAVGAPEALRACWYRNPSFSSALFTGAVRHFFGAAADIRAVTRMVSRIRPGEPGFPRREVEAVIRAALGETMFFDLVHPGQFSYPEIGIAVLDTLFREWQPGDAELSSLFRQVQEVQAAAYELSPELLPVEKDWLPQGCTSRRSCSLWMQRNAMRRGRRGGHVVPVTGSPEWQAAY
jgi:hypothetical protein